jgi:DNA-binding Xre family transcriptional regulator
MIQNNVADNDIMEYTELSDASLKKLKTKISKTAVATT